MHTGYRFISTVFILSAIKRVKKLFFVKALSLKFKSESIAHPYLNRTTSFEDTLSVLHQVKKTTVSIENERCELTRFPIRAPPRSCACQFRMCR